LSITKALFTFKYQNFKANVLGRDIVVVIATCYGLMRPGVSEIFRPCPDRHWSPTSLLYKAYRISLPGGYLECCMALTTFFHLLLMLQ